MKKLLFIIILSIVIFAKEVYFMPMQGKKAENKMFSIFSHAHNTIKILIYSFTNKKLAKALKIAAKKGVKIIIIADKKEAKYNKSQIPNLALIKNIKVYLISGKSFRNGDKAKMHVKMSLIDNKILVTGSANYSYSAFYKNYEYIIIEKDKNLIPKFNNFFEYILNKAKPFRLSR
ncbi:phospholipase D-like domain-containing protein [Caminibacter mediatlanticus]|uniref:phospholipase D n=1 Tax=Caminibacter mediatlanticus TB-2 TaxID=391592 RepID=A0AAI9AGN3_9BACT|nr:phospholipase D-like domain-containing protein [Caminibacter mediatlanticus]EDM23292.1 membrane bound endonuclease (nuc) [Caminibacter mediatlanticus TB-2]